MMTNRKKLLIECIKEAKEMRKITESLIRMAALTKRIDEIINEMKHRELCLANQKSKAA